MKKNKHLEEIRKEITPEIRKKVRQFVDDKIAKMSRETPYWTVTTTFGNDVKINYIII
jgi:hypothetical protein